MERRFFQAPNDDDDDMKEVMRLLFSRRIHRSCFDVYGQNPLVDAAWKGNLQLVSALLDRGAKVEAATKNGSTPLMAASSEGHINVAYFLLTKGARIDSTNENGNSSLHIAAREGRSTVVSLLVANGAKLLVANKEGKTALQVAYEKGHYDIVRKLQTAVNDSKSKQPTTPLSQKTSAKSSSASGSVNQGSPPSHKITPIVLAPVNRIEKQIKMGKELRDASGRGDVAVVRRLLLEGINSNCADETGFTPLHNVAWYGHSDMVPILLDNKANIEAVTKVRRQCCLVI